MVFTSCVTCLCSRHLRSPGAAKNYIGMLETICVAYLRVNTTLGLLCSLLISFTNSTHSLNYTGARLIRFYTQWTLGTNMPIMACLLRTIHFMSLKLGATAMANAKNEKLFQLITYLLSWNNRIWKEVILERETLRDWWTLGKLWPRR